MNAGVGILVVPVAQESGKRITLRARQAVTAVPAESEKKPSSHRDIGVDAQSLEYGISGVR